MSRYAYVVDTSYLTEYYKITGHYKEENHKEIKKRFDNAIKNEFRLYIPVPVIFEVANHIAHVNDGRQRRELAILFSRNIKSSFESESPFVLVPCEDFKSIECLVNNLMQFATQYAMQGLGSVDISKTVSKKFI